MNLCYLIIIGLFTFMFCYTSLHKFLINKKVFHTFSIRQSLLRETLPDINCQSSWLLVLSQLFNNKIFEINKLNSYVIFHKLLIPSYLLALFVRQLIRSILYLLEKPISESNGYNKFFQVQYSAFDSP